jgi:hypothetical protein
MRNAAPDATSYYGERGNYIQIKEKMRIKATKDNTEKEKSLKRVSDKNTLPPKEPGIRSTPNN